MKLRKDKMLTIRVTDELMRRLDMMAKLTGARFDDHGMYVSRNDFEGHFLI